MQPGVTMRADIMHPHRRREDACHLSGLWGSGRAILQRIATVSAPLQVGHNRKVCLELLGEKDGLDRLDSHRWRRRTKRGKGMLNEDFCIWFYCIILKKFVGKEKGVEYLKRFFWRRFMVSMFLKRNLYFSISYGIYGVLTGFVLLDLFIS